MFEQEFENILARYPELIEVGLSIEDRQQTVNGKRIDLVFRDRHNNKLIVELKCGTVTRSAVGQVMDYRGELSSDDPTTRTMLIGNRVPPSFQKSLTHHGVEWAEISHGHLTEFLTTKGDIEFLDYLEYKQKGDNTTGRTEVTDAAKQCSGHGEYEVETSAQPEHGLIVPGAVREALSSITERLTTVCKSLSLGQLLTRNQIIGMVEKRFPGTNRTSVIPSDYCYNIVNAGIDFTVHFFEHQRRRNRSKPQYKYLGLGFDYEGPIYWRRSSW